MNGAAQAGHRAAAEVMVAICCSLLFLHLVTTPLYFCCVL